MIRIACLLLAAFSFGWAAQPAVEFIQISDTHVVDLSDSHPSLAKSRAHYSKTGDALEQFFRDTAAKLRPSFILLTGDITDAYCLERAPGGRNCRGVEHVKPILALSPVPLYLVLGNHDIHLYRYSDRKKKVDSSYSVSGAARKEWVRGTASFRDGTYYSFEQRAGRTRYLFLVLDNGERKLAKKSKFSARQLAWLRQQMSASRDATLILVFHVPLGDDAVSSEIKSAVGNSHRVAMTIAGHRHSDAIEEISLGSRRITQVRTAAFGRDAKNWRRFRLTENGIEIGASSSSASIEKTVRVPMEAQPR